MPEDTSLDFIPDDLSEDAKSKLRELTVESVPEPASLDVNEYLIRHWCETLEDGNPLYLDDAYAKSKGYPGVLAPPGSFMTAFVMPFRWPWPPGGREPAPHIHYDIKDALGLPVGIIGSIDVEMGVPLHVGDRISVSQRLVDISPWKKTRLGEGHFWTMDRLYRNQNGELVARERMSAFGYGRDGESQQAPSGESGGGWSPAVEEMIQGERTGYQPPTYRNRHWEDVEEGEELPELVMPITFTRCVYGPESTVRRVSVKMRQNVCAGDDMIITGRVTRKYVEDGDHRIDMDVMISTQEGPATPCTGTLSLPTRAT
jgi:acyl dehydratase